MEMAAGEVIRNYRAAKNKNEQIQILADLNDCSSQEILDILTEAGEISGIRKSGGCRYTLTPEQRAEIVRLRDGGMKFGEIAERLGIKKNTVQTSYHRAKEAGKMATGSIRHTVNIDTEEKADRFYQALEETQAKAALPTEVFAGDVPRIQELTRQIVALNEEGLRLHSKLEQAELTIKSQELELEEIRELLSDRDEVTDRLREENDKMRRLIVDLLMENMEGRKESK